MVQGLRTLITCLYRQTGYHEIPRFLHARVGLEKDRLISSSCLLTIYAPYDSAEVYFNVCDSDNFVKYQNNK